VSVVIRARAGLVSARTALVNTVRGLTKSYGERLRECGTEQMNREIAKGLSQELREALEPLLVEIESLNERIRESDRRIEQIAKDDYPKIALLKQVKGVGTLTALTFMLTLDDPHRFRRSRDVGCFLGLRPGRRNSGNSQPQLHISKEGDRYLRTVLVQSAHYILGPFGQDCDLRRWGLTLAQLSQLRAISDIFAVIFVVKLCVSIVELGKNSRVETKRLPFALGLLAICPSACFYAATIAKKMAKIIATSAS
jgi:transposase